MEIDLAIIPVGVLDTIGDFEFCFGEIFEKVPHCFWLDSIASKNIRRVMSEILYPLLLCYPIEENPPDATVHQQGLPILWLVHLHGVILQKFHSHHVSEGDNPNCTWPSCAFQHYHLFSFSLSRADLCPSRSLKLSLS